MWWQRRAEPRYVRRDVEETRLTSLTVAVVDIGRPGANLGWAMSGPSTSAGMDIDECVVRAAEAARNGPLAFGFEAPMFVPYRSDATRLTAARHGECGGGYPNRPFPAGAGAAVTVTALVVVPYILRRLRDLLPEAVAWMDWNRMPVEACQLLLFEAFVTNQSKTGDTRHVDDARMAIAGFRSVVAGKGEIANAVAEADRLNLLGAMMLRSGWTTDISVLSEPCLVVRG